MKINGLTFKFKPMVHRVVLMSDITKWKQKLLSILPDVEYKIPGEVGSSTIVDGKYFHNTFYILQKQSRGWQDYKV